MRVFGFTWFIHRVLEKVLPKVVIILLLCKINGLNSFIKCNRTKANGQISGAKLSFKNRMGQ